MASIEILTGDKDLSADFEEFRKSKIEYHRINMAGRSIDIIKNSANGSVVINYFIDGQKVNDLQVMPGKIIAST